MIFENRTLGYRSESETDSVTLTDGRLTPIPVKHEKRGKRRKRQGLERERERREKVRGIGKRKKKRCRET
jgi:hypothetical protein